jgi:two-component system phosphate regulon sensor histidine kinase PhoR
MVEGAQFMRAVIDALDEPIIIVEGWLVRLANPRAMELLGEGIEGRDVRLAIRHPQALERILARDAGEIDVVGIGDPGRSWRLVIEDLGAQTVLVRLVERTNLVSAEKMRVDFVANASHELRTPLATIIGYAETLAEGAELPDEVRTGFSRTISEEARRMLRIIEDLMSLSRIEADRFVAPTDLVNVGDIIAASVGNMGLLVGSRECHVDTDLSAGLPEIRGDFWQLVQVLDNLLGNATRYGCSDASCTIRVLARGHGGFVHIQVEDDGPGIAKEHLPRLTERFYRVDAARSRDSGGTGLGLAIVKHIVERHRGTLEINSNPGSGTSITVSLPAAA